MRQISLPMNLPLGIIPKALRLTHSAVAQYSLLALVTLIAGLLRFYRLGEWSLWLDEVFSINHSLALDSPGKVFSSYHPLFYILLRPILIYFGIDEWSTRLPAAVIGTVSIPIFALIVRRLLGFPAALLTAVLLTFAPWHLYWSQNVRFYTLLFLLFNLALFGFYWGIETDRFRYILLSALAWLLAMAAHETAVLLAVILTLYFLLLKVLPLEKPPGLRWRALLPFTIVPLALYLAYDLFRVFYPGHPSVLTNFVQVFIGRPSTTPYSLIVTFTYRVGTPLALLAASSLIFLITRRDRVILLLALTAGLPIAVTMAFSLISYAAVRYAFISLLSSILLGVYVVQELYRRAQAGRTIALWALGIALIAMQDPLLDDAIYYSGPSVRLIPPIIGLLSLLVLALSKLVGARPGRAEAITERRLLARAARRRETAVWALGILFPLLLHPIVADILYYRFQNGHRDDWRALIATIQERKRDGDVVASLYPPLLTYYLRESTPHLKRINPDAILARGQRLWFVEDPGVRKFYPGLAAWGQAYYQEVTTLSNYAAGRDFRVVLRLCTPSSEAASAPSRGSARLPSGAPR